MANIWRSYCADLQELGPRYMVVSLLCEYNSVFLHLVRSLPPPLCACLSRHLTSIARSLP